MPVALGSRRSPAVASGPPLVTGVVVAAIALAQKNQAYTCHLRPTVSPSRAAVTLYELRFPLPLQCRIQPPERYQSMLRRCTTVVTTPPSRMTFTLSEVGLPEACGLLCLAFRQE